MQGSIAGNAAGSSACASNLPSKNERCSNQYNQQYQHTSHTMTNEHHHLPTSGVLLPSSGRVVRQIRVAVITEESTPTQHNTTQSSENTRHKIGRAHV